MTENLGKSTFHTFDDKNLLYLVYLLKVKPLIFSYFSPLSFTLFVCLPICLFYVCLFTAFILSLCLFVVLCFLIVFLPLSLSLSLFYGQFVLDRCLPIFDNLCVFVAEWQLFIFIRTPI